MFVKLFIRILAIFCMVGFGALARRLNILNAETNTRMSRVTTNFFYPALIFTTLVGNFTFKGLIENWFLPAGALLIMISGYVLGMIIHPFINFSSNSEKNQFLFQCTINNYSFLPLPIVLMLWGNTGVATLIFSTLGSELAVWTLGILALTGNKFSKESLKQLFSAPIISIFIAVGFIAIRDCACLPAIPPFLQEAGRSFFSSLDMLGKGTIPVAMFIAGSKMTELKPHHLFTVQQGYVVGLRLLVIPAIAAALLYLLPFPQESRLILLVVAAMPSAIASVVLSEVYGLDAEFAASCVLTTHIFSLITIPMWLSFFLR